jgi:hypothetical protein
MTQLRFQSTKVINDCRTPLQFLKDFRHHMLRHRETRRPRYPMPGGITVYPCPWPDLGHRIAKASHEFGTDGIASLCLSFFYKNFHDSSIYVQ